MPEFSQALGDAVKSARYKLQLTQSEVADLADVDVRTVLNIENYKGNPKMEVLYPLVRALKLDPRNIFYPQEYPENSAVRELRFLIDVCRPEEAAILLPVVESLLQALRSSNCASSVQKEAHKDDI